MSVFLCVGRVCIKNLIHKAGWCVIKCDYCRSLCVSFLRSLTHTHTQAPQLSVARFHPPSLASWGACDFGGWWEILCMPELTKALFQPHACLTSHSSSPRFVLPWPRADQGFPLEVSGSIGWLCLISSWLQNLSPPPPNLPCNLPTVSPSAGRA